MNEKISHISRRSSTSGSALDMSGNSRNMWNFMADIGLQQVAAAMQSTSALYRGRENLHRIQQETAQEAAVRYGEAAEKLKGPCQPADVLPIQSELLRANLQSASQYWQQLMSVALQTQKEMMSSMNHLFDAEKGKSVLDVFQAIPAMTSSFFVHDSNREVEQPQHH